MKTKPLFTSAAVLGTLLVLTAGTAHADLILDVTMNTTPLTTAPAAAPVRAVLLYCRHAFLAEQAGTLAAA
jgi:hypothetical protein